MQSKNITLKICLVTFCLLRSSYALGLPEFDGATFYMRKINSLHDRIDGRYMPEPNTGCWLWMHSLNRKGYGTLGIGGGIVRAAHRISYIVHKGEIPDSFLVCHTCDNPSCINPNHLYLGTHQDNVNDRVRRGRSLNNQVCGDTCRLSKLKAVDVIIIKEALSLGFKIKYIARYFNVNYYTIHRIKQGTHWNHLKLK